MINVASDAAMGAPSIAVADTHVKLGGGRTYVYLFSAHPSTSPMELPKWFNGK